MLKELINNISNDSIRILVIGTSTCPFCKIVYNLFHHSLKVPFKAVKLDLEYDNKTALQIRDEMQSQIGARSVPQVFLDKNHIGDCSEMLKKYNSGELHKIFGLEIPKYDYEFAVIGGGSGGIAAVKKASELMSMDNNELLKGKKIYNI